MQMVVEKRQGLMIDLNDEFDEDNFSSDSNGDEFVQNLETFEKEWNKFDVLKEEEIMNMTFDSKEKAGEFYNRETKCFNLTNRKREPKAISRVGYNAMFGVKYDYKVQKFVVEKFIALHSHELARKNITPFL
ncbi:hypothetical protein ACH5RR_033996 [Cinchona calisaya]|uniref:Protein FAR1-RELATED SEQUENCE n=1 Tax=Cinchona calisaya TaxID=153742 RepID=A0ABD2YAH1_9GENT